MAENIEVYNYMLQSGYIFFSKEPAVISTVLGSCVSVALYDTKLKYGGMNHFRFPRAENLETTAFYAKPAIYKLILFFSENKSDLKNLVAQIFGGAYNPKYMAHDIGKENVAVAKMMLKKYNIPIISEDIGGQLGRKIVYNTFTNEAIIAKVERLRADDWY